MHKGFTLIELLIVIAVVGILSGIAIVTIRNPSESATIAVVKANARQIETVIAIQKIKRATPTEIAAEINKIDVPLAAKVIGSWGYIREKFGDATVHKCSGDLSTFLNSLNGGGGVSATTVAIKVGMVTITDLEKTIFCRHGPGTLSTTFALLVSIHGNQDLYYCATNRGISPTRPDRNGFYKRNVDSTGKQLAAGCIVETTNSASDKRANFLDPAPISK